MSEKIHLLEERNLNRIAKRICTQSEHHRHNITQYMLIMRHAITEEFTEDNSTTLDCFLRDCLDDALRVHEYEKEKE